MLIVENKTQQIPPLPRPGPHVAMQQNQTQWDWLLSSTQQACPSLLLKGVLCEVGIDGRLGVGVKALLRENQDGPEDIGYHVLRSGK